MQWSAGWCTFDESEQIMRMLSKTILRRLCVVILALGLVCPAYSLGDGRPVASGSRADLYPSLRKDAMRAIRIGLGWLEAQQAENGHWSSPQFPAVTALVVWANLRSPDAISVDENGWQQVEISPHVQKGIDYILGCVREDGGIYVPIQGRKGGGLKNYNTAVCMTALAACGGQRYEATVNKAKQYLVGLQYLGGGVFDGGMGYDAATDREYTDMSNTFMAVEAVRFAEFVQDSHQVQCFRPGDMEVMKKVRKLREEAAHSSEREQTLKWDRFLQFATRCQNLPGTNKGYWVSPHKNDRGGFVYHPERAMAGERVMPDGNRYLRSYGSITYAGLLSLIYADVDRDDPRVVAAYDWIRQHYTLDENPGMGQQGLYYGYHTMAKALAAYGDNLLKLPDGRVVDWRSDLVNKLVSLQRIDPKTGLGYWVNDNGRFWENDPVLTTSYATLTLEICLEGATPAP